MNRVASLAVLAAAAVLAGCEDTTRIPDPPTVTLNAAPSSISSGQSVTLTWTSEQADTCAASGAWSGTLPTSGSQSMGLFSAGSRAFVVTCSGPGGTGTAVAEVDVNPSGSGQIPVAIYADPTLVAVGGSTTLTWSAPTATSCTASGEWSGTKSPSGSQVVTVSGPGYRDFELTCSGPDGLGYNYAFVQSVEAYINLWVEPATAGVGQAVEVSWLVTYGDTCEASGAWSGAKGPSGSQTVTLPSLGEHTFTLTCSDPGSEATKSVTATGVVPEVTLKAFPVQPATGETFMLSWDSPYALECTAAQGTAGWPGAVATKGTANLTAVAGTTTYELTCDNDGGSDTATVQVTPVAPTAMTSATTTRLNPQHDGRVTFPGGITLPASATPTWTVDLDYELAEPLIADGRVLLAVRNSDGSYGNRLYALQLGTGSTVWGPVGVPGVYWMRKGLATADGKVFTLNHDGLVRTFDAATGAGLWSKQLPGYSYDGAPVAFGGLLFVTGNGGTQALDPATGDILWSRPLDSDAAPAVTATALYLGTTYDCIVYALNPLTGDVLWSNSACNNYAREVAVANGLVYASTSINHVGIFDAATGADAGFSAASRAVAIGDSSLISLYSGTLTATSLATGTQLWQFTGDGNLAVAPIIVNDTVFVGTSTGKVYGVNLATGAQQWMGTTPALGSSSSTYPTITAGEGWLIVNGGGIVAAWPLQ